MENSEYSTTDDATETIIRAPIADLVSLFINELSDITPPTNDATNDANSISPISSSDEEPLIYAANQPTGPRETRGRHKKYKTVEEREDAIRLYGINYRRKLKGLEPITRLNENDIKRGRPRKYGTLEEAKEKQREQVDKWQIDNKDKWRAYMKEYMRTKKKTRTSIDG
jgi:hypothetical protein